MLLEILKKKIPLIQTNKKLLSSYLQGIGGFWGFGFFSKFEAAFCFDPRCRIYQKKSNKTFKKLRYKNVTAIQAI